MKKILFLFIFLLTINVNALSVYNDIVISDDNVNIRIMEEYFDIKKNDILKDKLELAEKNGFTIMESDSGYMFTKTTDLNSVSTNDKVVGNISIDQLSNKIFKVKKGFLSNTYYANLTSTDIKEVKEILNNENEDYSNIDLELIFRVSIDSKIISHNADTVRDENILSWNLEGDDKNITFTFKKSNKKLLMTIILVIAIVAFIISEIIKRKKRGIMQEVGPNIETTIDNQKDLNTIDDQIIEKPIPQIIPRKMPATGKKINPSTMPSNDNNKGDLKYL